MKRFAEKAVGLILLGVVVVMCVRCGGGEGFTQQATTQYFLQDFNPETIDVLFVVNNTSPMFRAREHIVGQLSKFFERLDAIPQNYQMAVTTADMRINNGRLQPTDNPLILKKNVGTLESRVKAFASMLSNVINLKADYQDKGFEASWVALNLYFKPRAKIPLVLVFVSDSDDVSPFTGTDAVEDYANRFLNLKANNKDLLRVYSVNYTPLNGAPETDENRCATTKDRASIDNPGFQDRFFKLAQKVGGATADLCKPFADQINLSGLREKELPRRFQLDKKPIVNSLIVSVFRTATKEAFDLKWTYDEKTNEIVFDETPPDGTTIQVTYHSGS